MLGKALYYPYVDIRDGAWLRSAILFWDEIQSIVPPSIHDPYHSPDTRICEQEGYLRPLRCDLNSSSIRQLGKQIARLIEDPDWLSQLYAEEGQRNPSVNTMREADSLNQSFRKGFAAIYPEKIAPELQDILLRARLGRLHREKIPRELLHLLDGQRRWTDPTKIAQELKRVVGYRAEYEGDWLLVDSRFANLYMSALASTLAKENKLSALTSHEPYHGLNLKCVLDDVAAVGSSSARGALVTLVMQGLRMDPDTSVKRLIAFRRAREKTQLADLSAAFDDLTVTIEKCESHRELEEKAKRIYQNVIGPGLLKLKKELEGQTIQSVWEGFFQGALVSVGAGAPLAHFTTLSPGELMVAGLFLTVTNIGVKSYFARSKAGTSSRYTYFYDAYRKFSLSAY